MPTRRLYFTQSFCLQSLTKYDKDMLLHGEQRSWWDRNHHYPKELSIYQHGTLIRSIVWYINGNIKKSVNTYRDMKEICEYYCSSQMKYRQNYKLSEKGFVRHGEWSGFYRNGNKHYEEVYDKGDLVSRTRYVSTGHPLSGYGTSKPRETTVVSDNSNKVSDNTVVISDNTTKEGLSSYLKGLLGRFIKF